MCTLCVGGMYLLFVVCALCVDRNYVHVCCVVVCFCVIYSCTNTHTPVTHSSQYMNPLLLAYEARIQELTTTVDDYKVYLYTCMACLRFVCSVNYTYNTCTHTNTHTEQTRLTRTPVSSSRQKERAITI